ncbi:Dyp-type peroxidase [Corynebacterium bovis]|uniref:Dyp-type peroxidase n=1 Tax=Corynebacterium bovis TaxID=36808 RepID=UPI003138D6D8
MSEPAVPAGPSVTRRGFLAGVGVASAGVSVAAVAAACSATDGTGRDRSQAGNDGADAVPAQSVPFDGEHQAGIGTPAQRHNVTVAFDLRRGAGRREVQRLLRIWTGDARRMCGGRPALADLEPELSAEPANLTVTCGFGEGLFRAAGWEDVRPAWLAPLPAFRGDRLDPRWGGGDIVLQVCGDDRTTLSHALRVLVRGGADYARPRWTQRGFLDMTRRDGDGDRGGDAGAASGPSPDQAGRAGTPRNLFGFKDGTVNPRTAAELDDQVWIPGPGPTAGGTAMIVRRIAFDMPAWEEVDRDSREVAFGRTVTTGAPLTGGDEFTPADFDRLGDDGLPVIDRHSHMALATHEGRDPRQRMLRRAYNYDEPVSAGDPTLSDSGLIFTCFQRDPRESFIPVQRRLAEGDRLNQWITHVGSAVFLCPPGTTGGDTDYWGRGLLEG